MIRQYWYLAAAALALLAAWTWSCAMAGPNGYLEYRRKRVEFLRLEAAVRAMQQENEQLEQHIKGLRNDPRVLEEEARKQQFVRPGERVYILPEPHPGGQAAEPRREDPAQPSDSAELAQRAQPTARQHAPAGDGRPLLKYLSAAMAIGAIISGAGACALRLRRAKRRAPLASA